MDEELIELYYSIVEFLFDHIQLAVCAFSFYLLCRGFLKTRRKILILCTIWLGTMLFQYYIPVYMGGMIASAVGSLVVFIAMLFMTGSKENAKSLWGRNVSCKEQAPICFYLATTFFFIQRLAESGIALELYLSVADKLWQVMNLNLDVSAPDVWVYYFVLECLSLLLFFALTSILMISFVMLTNRVFYDKDGTYGWKEIGILSVPSFACITVQMLCKAYEDLVYKETGMYAFHLLHMIGVLLSLNYLVLFLINFIELYLYQNLRKRQEEEKKKSLLQNQMKDIQSHITEVERIYTGIRGVRHDLNNHIHIIGSLLEQKQYPEAEQYLETLRNTVELFDFPVKTGNPVTDVIVNERYREAERKKIEFTSDFHFIQECNINAFDISIILNNTLENAFEAADRSKARRVSLRSERRKNAWFLMIENSYDGTLCPGRDGLPVSDKEEADMHGLGLKNIKSVTERYYGTFAIEQKGEEVAVTIMLMLD